MSALANFNDQRQVIDLSNHQGGLLLTDADMQVAELHAAQPLNIAPVRSEFQRTWIRPAAAQWAEACSQIDPHSQPLIESYLNAHLVANGNKTKSSQH